MEYQYLVGGIIDSALLLLLFYRTAGKSKMRAFKETSTEEVFLNSESGISLSEKVMNTDIIIVGSGVAGSALAYTLGKVNFAFFFSLLYLPHQAVTM